MSKEMSLADVIGLESIKLGFFREVQRTINELKASNIELEQKRRDVQAILNGIPDVMVVMSLDFEILSVNESFHDKYDITNPCGKPCYKVFKGKDAPCSPCSLVMAKEGSCKAYRHTEILNLGGENRQIECTASLMQDAHGNPNRVLMLQRDVTLEKQYQAKYFQAERMATIGVLAEGVAHEINNPLTSISGFAETLAQRLPTLAERLKPDEECAELLDNFKEYLQIILKECARCSGIVQNLLTFGHKKVHSFSIVNLNDVVSNSIKLLHPRLSNLPENIISLQLSEQEPYVLGHPGELMQVALNLVLNALYAVQESGKITISTAVEDNMAILKVADTGHGILEAHLDKLFEPFFTTKPVGQGIGIGLSTCYNIISKHGGDITVASKHLQGATFEVALPYLYE